MKYIVLFIVGFGLSACGEPPCKVEASTQAAEAYRNCIMLDGTDGKAAQCGRAAYNTFCVAKKD